MMTKHKNFDDLIWERIKHAIEQKQPYSGMIVTKSNFRDRIAKPYDDKDSAPSRQKSFANVSKNLRYLRRDKLALERRLDLHGLHILEALDTLESFFQKAIRDKIKFVLVITGKGSGKIRNAFLEWTTKQSFILSVHESDQKHGGSGAFYVLLRQKG